MTPRDANALAGLRAARRWLWTGEHRWWKGLDVRRVCAAVKKAYMNGYISREEWQDAWAVLAASMQTTTSKTLMEWIAENGGAEWLETATDRDKQQVRHLWLEKLISDLEARG